MGNKELIKNAGGAGSLKIRKKKLCSKIGSKSKNGFHVCSKYQSPVKWLLLGQSLVMYTIFNKITHPLQP